MAALAGKGGNKGRAPKYSDAPATVGRSPFKHSQPLAPAGPNKLIPLKPKYNGWKGW